MPYEDEILKELEEGKTYPESVIFNLLDNKDVIVISQSCEWFKPQSSREFTVLKKCIGYMHTRNAKGIYCVPSSKSTIYYVN